MKKLLLFLFFLWPLVSISQNFEWALSCAKGEGDDFGKIVLSRNGDIYMTGNYTQMAGIFGPDTLIPWGLGGEYLNIMLSKINSSGVFQWTTSIKTESPPCSIAKTFVEPSRTSDEVFLFGNICGDNYFDSIHLVSTEHSIFFSRYNSSGKCLWAIEPSNNKTCYITDLTLDSLDNVYITGWAGDTINFNGLEVLPGMYNAKFTSSGICQWIENMHVSGGTFYCMNFCVLDDGSIVLLGETNSPVLYVETDTLRREPGQGYIGYDLVLVKYDSIGNYLWSKLDGQTGAIAKALRVKPSVNGQFFVLGEQDRDTLVFGSFILPNHSPSTQMYLVKYGVEGNVIWATNTQSRWAETMPQDLFITNEQKIYITGGTTKSDTVHFGSRYIFTTENGMFVACYDSSGNCLGLKYAEGIPGNNEPPHIDGASVAADDNGNCVVAGQFDGTAYFDATTLTSMGMKDIFIAKCTPLTGEQELKTTPQNQLLIYANPNTGKCNITIPEEFANEKNLVLQIFDLQGKLIQQSKIEITDGKIRLDIQAQAKGMYTAILSNGKRSYTGKIVFE